VTQEMIDCPGARREREGGGRREEAARLQTHRTSRKRNFSFISFFLNIFFIKPTFLDPFPGDGWVFLGGEGGGCLPLYERENHLSHYSVQKASANELAENYRTQISN